MSDIDVEAIESEAQFEQFLDEGGVVDWLLGSSPEAEDASDTEEPQVERPRDPETGRFVASRAEEEQQEEQEEVQAPEEPEEEGEPPAEAPEEQVFEIDPQFANVLEKYDGDLNKALAALSDSQSLIGRQGNELGEIRQQLSQMQQMMSMGQRRAAPYENDIDEDPRAVVFEAMDRGDGDTLQTALQAWGEVEPFEAAQFLFTLPQMLRDLEEQAPAQAPQGADLQTEMAAVVQRHPDVDKFLPVVGEIAKEFPTLRGTLERGSPSQKAQAFEELVRIAKSRQAADTSSQAIKKAVLKAEEEARRERAEAAVVSASQNAAKPSSQSRVDEFTRLFREATGQPLDDD